MALRGVVMQRLGYPPEHGTNRPQDTCIGTTTSSPFHAHTEGVRSSQTMRPIREVVNWWALHAVA